MNRKFYLAIIIAEAIIIIPMLSKGINEIVTIVTAFTVVIGGYLLWTSRKNKKLAYILDEECDPFKAINAYEKYKSLSKRKEFQNACNLNIAIAHICAGQYAHSGEILKNMDLDTKNSKVFQINYQQACFVQYINTDELQKATYEYENHIKHLGKKLLSVNAKFAVELSILEYNYSLNKSEDTTKFYLSQLNFLYESYKSKISKRLKLAALYNMACLEQELGNNDAAIKKFKVVAEYGNKLVVAEDSRERLRNIIIS